MRNGVPPSSPDGNPSAPASGGTAAADGRPTRSGRRTLSRDDWAQAALEAMRAKGLAGVAVEPLAERLSTTKGSFYWHFKDRDALIQAALELWLAESELFMAKAKEIADPVERGRWITEFAFNSPASADITTTLLVNAQHPVVGPFLEKVTRDRLAFGAQMNEEQGLDPVAARQQALAAWMMVVGISLVRHGAPQLFPQGGDHDVFVHYVMDLMTPQRGDRT
jgi:AcrR family transcriptional regulator